MVQSHRRSPPGSLAPSPARGAAAAHPKEHFGNRLPIPRGCAGKPEGAEGTLAALPCSRLAPESGALCPVACRALKSTNFRGLWWQVHKGGPFRIFADEKKTSLYCHTCHAGLTGTRLLPWCHSAVQKAGDDTFTATDLPSSSASRRGCSVP